MPRHGCIGRPTVQIHPTRRCNLSCLHCYSESGPKVAEALPPDVIHGFLEDAREQGYEVAAFSGGEPFLYPEMAGVAEFARRLGFVTSCVTNGTVRGSRFESVAPAFDAVAVSVDGRPEQHDRLRNAEGSFDATLRGLATLRRLGVPFGIAHTVRKATIPLVRWLAEMAISEGAQLLQLHPLGAVGAAAGVLDAEVPSLEDCARLHLLAAIVGSDRQTELRIQVDLMNRELALSRPALVLADDDEDDRDAPLSSLVNPLVLSASGDVIPITHGLSPRFWLGNVRRGRLRDAVRSYLDLRHGGLRELCRTIVRDEVAHLELPYFDWYGMLSARSHDEPARPAASLRAVV